MEKQFNFDRTSLYDYNPATTEVRNGVLRLTKTYANPVNQAVHIPPTSSESVSPTELAKITNGDFNSWCDMGTVSPCSVMIDLGDIKTLNKVKVWGLFHKNRAYHDRIVQISENGTDWFTIFNNDVDNSAGQGAGTDGEYIESAEGRSFTIPNFNGQYVRVWSAADTLSGNAAFVEIEVYETIFSTDPQWCKTNETVTANLLSSLAATVSLGGGVVMYNLIVDGIIYWWDGVSWIEVDVPDYFRTNTLVEITSNWLSFVETNSPRYFKFMFWLEAATGGSGTPEFDQVIFGFDIDISAVPQPKNRVVFGYIYNGDDASPKANVHVTANLIGLPRGGCNYDDQAGNASLVTPLQIETNTNQYGYFAFQLITTDNLYYNGVQLTNAKWKVQTSDGITKIFPVDSMSLTPINIGEL